MNSPHLSRHVENDDPRHYRFERSSGLPIGYFPRDPLEWMTRRRVRWTAIALLLLGLVALAVIGDGGMVNW